MALVIHLKKGGQIIVNGAVLENASNRPISLIIKNDAAILRGEDILAPEAAATPATRIYYVLQCAYLFNDQRGVYLHDFVQLLDDYLQAAPSALPIIEEIRAIIEPNNLYAALKKARVLIEHEGKVLTHVQERLVEKLQDDPAAR
jgi:flagellar protein FlbT